VNKGHIGWADIIFVMEKQHGRILRQRFGEALDGKTVICLRIPDVYHYMEPALIDELKAALSGYIELPQQIAAVTCSDKPSRNTPTQQGHIRRG
jgi:predicted protein tyrosine phosphatase